MGKSLALPIRDASMVQLRVFSMYKEKMDKAVKEGKISSFRAGVLKALLEIPEGRVTTYKHLAQYVNCASSQAIGQAIKLNPWSPGVPCHRVIKTNLNLGGFHGETEGPQIARKRKILASEGVLFSEEGELSNAEQVFNFK